MVIGDRRVTKVNLQHTGHRLKQKVDDGGILEENLREIVQDNGEVNWHKNPDSGYVEVLFIQTSSMRSDIDRTRPYIWQCDTTFKTNRYTIFLHFIFKNSHESKIFT